MAQRFGDYFIEKVHRSVAMVATVSDDTGFCGVPLTCFASGNESDVMRLDAVAPCKSRELDAVPARLLKQCSRSTSH